MRGGVAVIWLHRFFLKKIMEDLVLFNEIGITQCNIVEKTRQVYDYGKLLLTSVVKKDEYTQYIEEHFDLKIEDTCTVEIPCKLKLDNLKPWNIGVICGASGSGKSTILKNIGNIYSPTFDCSKTLISNFEHISPEEACFLLSSMGLASVPTWIKPYNVLSNGEKYRADLAKAVSCCSNEIILIDEYTSVVDRNVAKAMSNALQKYIRKYDKKIILATCHYDIFEWLQPDWIYDLNKGGAFEECDYLRQGKPKIELQVYRTTYDTWERFKKHHYMTADLNKAASCFCFTWNNNLVAFESILPFPNGSIKNGVREHRLVVLPDYQGLGIGSKVSEFIGGIYKAKGYTLYCKTINPRLGLYRSSSKNWSPSSTNMTARSEKEVSKEHNIMGGLTRPSYCHKYIGDSIFGYEDLVKSIPELKKMEHEKYQLHFDL